MESLVTVVNDVCPSPGVASKITYNLLYKQWNKVLNMFKVYGEVVIKTYKKIQEKH